ncbi:site-specific integrase [Caloramator sp. E03]|uniref:tyrosine-type recombinase/integrase n=1 Tax=Caloramator sp. E03 TaxID=2576307 RepID=UPI001110C962|nr:site-specific integrase [Caloramator sp. E03]QCX33507.1 site-specific integrase [Caloramator sp. E03]
MPKKRGNNEGTIYRRPNGLWCAQITLGRDEMGKLKRMTFYGKTRQEVSEKINKALTSYSAGILVEPSQITLGNWLNTWLFEYKKNSLRPSTLQSYEYLIRYHINPALGHYKLKELRSEHIQLCYNEKLKEGLSPKTIRNLHNVINAALKQAVKNNLITRNVTETTSLPKYKKKEIKVLTLEEQDKFIKALEGERLKAAFILALSTGLRQGELLALTWDNIDFKEGTLTVKKSLKRVKNFDKSIKKNTVLIFQEPKTSSGIRIVPIPPSVIEELKEHRKAQLQEKLKAGEVYEDNNLVFASELGRPIEHSHLLRVFYRITEKANIDINFHALRHTYATRLLETNEHPKVVQEILGHKDITTTLNIYSHVMPEVKKAAAMKINHLFEIDKKNKKSN